MTKTTGHGMPLANSVFPAFTLKETSQINHKKIIMEDKIELSLHTGTYAINPCRIIAVESHEVARFSNGNLRRNAFSEDEAYKDGTPICYDQYVIIHMTDDFNIEFTTDNSSYERLRDELKNIVGG